jgi:hypothetical protein
MSLPIPVSAFVVPQMIVEPAKITVLRKKGLARRILHVKRNDDWVDGALVKAAVTHSSLDATVVSSDPATGRAEIAVLICELPTRELKLIDRSVVLTFENASDTRITVPVVVAD